MLSVETRRLIKATIPLLKEQGLNLTRYFYQRLFERHPELKNVFNQNHQQDSQQQQALAAAVLAYAEHIDNPAVLMPVLNLIANKHASLGVKAEHYPIVGENLLASIRAVLGAEIATDEILAAWSAAYTQLADLLIAAEAGLYQQASSWSGFRAFVIERKEQESDEIVSLYLTPVDNAQKFEFKPGQYVSVRVALPTGLLQPRQYSLSDAPGLSHLRISVKREPMTEHSVSNLLHDRFQVGDQLELSPPMGSFHLHAERQNPVVWISGGVGFTPLLSMLKHLTASGSSRKLAWLHACRHGRVDALKALWPAEAAIKPLRFYEAPLATDIAGEDFDYSGRIDWSALPAAPLWDDADYYLCGPRAFMQQQRQQLLQQGIAVDRVHMEVFGSGSV